MSQKLARPGNLLIDLCAVKTLLFRRCADVRRTEDRLVQADDFPAVWANVQKLAVAKPRHLKALSVAG